MQWREDAITVLLQECNLIWTALKIVSNPPPPRNRRRSAFTLARRSIHTHTPWNPRMTTPSLIAIRN